MSGKMRLTAHNGRSGKHGVYSAKHNDRNFTSEAEHIDKTKNSLNVFWHRYSKTDPDLTFEDAEKRFYEDHFQTALDKMNAKAVACRHRDRIKTMDQYRQSKKSCPEEEIIQIGCKDNTVDNKLLWTIVAEQIQWEMLQFPQYKVLDVALHMDEEGAPHIHKRGVWVAHDIDGVEIVGQAKALEEMGVKKPDPEKKQGRYNNPKMTYTRLCREHLFELAKKHGLNLEKAPKEHSRAGLSLEEYKANQEIAKAMQAQKDYEDIKSTTVSMQNTYCALQKEIKDLQQKKETLFRDSAKQYGQEEFVDALYHRLNIVPIVDKKRKKQALMKALEDYKAMLPEGLLEGLKGSLGEEGYKTLLSDPERLYEAKDAIRHSIQQAEGISDPNWYRTDYSRLEFAFEKAYKEYEEVKDAHPTMEDLIEDLTLESMNENIVKE